VGIVFNPATRHYSSPLEKSGHQGRDSQPTGQGAELLGSCHGFPREAQWMPTPWELRALTP